MKNTTLNIGGELVPGDVVGISYNNYIQFGWYVESGQYGSLKFITFRMPAAIATQHKEYLDGTLKGNWIEKKYSKGIQFRHFAKDYIITFNGVNNRAFKVSNPAEFFKGADIETQYLEGKEILNNNNFPAK